MLQLTDINKDYTTGDSTVHALKDINLSFRENEFVAILGPSGGGKTTLLNIIGGLDHYTSGDLIINGRSTKSYNDQDWDRYRNKTIGFVFQSYNLIPHQSVLKNVELALTLAGINKKERKERAEDALRSVGLGDQINKKPNQLSGGQMQRVAIARALVNHPDILLADEPTGALDTETSKQVMNILAEVAKDKLVIMVTHNPDLASEYATRTVRILDGKIVSDSDAYIDVKQEAAVKLKKHQKKSFMSFFTALGLSLNNLMTKKGRTTLTAFAGSIGIIGIALILSLSTGIQNYIDRIQEDTLSSYPITIESETLDMSDMMQTLMGNHKESMVTDKEEDRVYSNTILYDMMNAFTSSGTTVNNLKAFRSYIEDRDNGFYDYANNIVYKYGDGVSVYTTDVDGKIIATDAMSIMSKGMSGMYQSSAVSFGTDYFSSYTSVTTWEELLPGNNGSLVSDVVKAQYDLVYGSWPNDKNEVVLVISENNELSDIILYALGLKSMDEMEDALQGFMSSETVEMEVESWSFEEILEKRFKLILDGEKYEKNIATGCYTDLSETDAGMDYLYNSDNVGLDLRIVGIIKPNEDAGSNMIGGSLCYTSALTQYVIEETSKLDVVKDQIADKDTDVINGLPFKTDDYEEPEAEEKIADIKDYVKTLDKDEQAEIYINALSVPSESYVEENAKKYTENLTREKVEEMMVSSYAEQIGQDSETIKEYISKMDDETLFEYVDEAIRENMKQQYANAVKAQLANLPVKSLSTMLVNGVNITDEQYVWIYDNYMPPVVSESSYSENIKAFGYLSEDDPDEIIIYVSSFSDKDEITALITAYNESVEEDDKIAYTDYVALLMSSITKIINAVSYVLIAFVAISLVVSSIMIAIITYISVLERTKEIGILRAVGASKKDISRVFNAETVIEGLFSGLMGVGITLLLLIPINLIIHNLTGIESLNASLPRLAAVLLVILSIVLTFIAGLVPSGIAAKKDPVIALRTE